MKLKLILTIIVFMVLNVMASSNLKIEIDTIICRYYEKDSLEISLKVNWRICNVSKEIISNINEPWYLYPEDVKTDSTYLKRLKKNVGPIGIGNTKLIFFQADTTTLPMILGLGYINAPQYDNSRFILYKDSCASGSIGGVFKISNRNTDSFSLQIEYDTRFQRAGNKPLWRGRLLSDKVPIKIPDYKVEEIKQ